jgi:hypothetical protein
VDSSCSLGSGGLSVEETSPQELTTSAIADRRVRRGGLERVQELEAAIAGNVQKRNAEPEPLVRTATGTGTLEKAPPRGRHALESEH